LLLSALLVVPGQIQELYRIAADDVGWVTVKELVAISLIAVTIWLGAFQLTTASIPQKPSDTGLLATGSRLAPVVLGGLPLLAAAIGQFVSRPDSKMRGLEEVGSIYRIQEKALAIERPALLALAVVILLLLLVFVLLARRAGSSSRLIALSQRANDGYFSRYRFIVLTIVAIGLLTTAFVLFPDTIPQFVGSFGVIALFTMCVVGVMIHCSLLTIQHSLPYLPLIFGGLFVLAAFAGSDNHELRTVAQTATGQDDSRIPAVTAFQKWLSQPSRVADAARLGEYPVFIVAAQGGGIYAAHNAARFLARMQDFCPAFRQHLFAISSVSGGSVGSATFAAALHAEKTPQDPAALAGQACPKIAQFLAGVGRAEDLDVPGPVEQRVAGVLTKDFLSPLVGGFLFSDFTQLFSPFAIPFFDRARSLEYTLENSADRMLKVQKPTGDPTNLLKADFQSHWTPDNNMPALLLNTTDVGSGKRVVISPFDIDPLHPKDTDLCVLANLDREVKGGEATVKSTSLHIPLSTAAFASARFPWVTPASTVTLTNDCITANSKARLVDGGYVENSGIETALDLIEKLNSVRGTSDAPKFRIYLLSLVSGNFEDHGAFSFGELMEPVRALLSTRTSRTYTALNRAVRDDRAPPKEVVSAVLSFPTFGRTDITGLFYSLPLGWTLSEKTGDIISLSSGRFWDCLPKDDFNQSRVKQSNADCLQVKVFHLLNGSVASAFQSLKDAKLADTYVDSLAKENPKAAKIRPQRLLACYESKWLQERGYEKYQARLKDNEAKREKAIKDGTAVPDPLPPYRELYVAYFQAEQIKALLQEWDRVEETDPRMLAYILGSVSYDSADFTRKSENFSFSGLSQIPAAWRARIDKINAALVAANKPPVDVNSLLNHPREFTNFVLGFEGNDFQNQPGTDDGWDFRPRGMYQLVGREQYQGAQDQIHGLGQLPGLDLLTFPEALWNVKISAKVTFAHFRTHRYHGRTLFELLKDSSLTWQGVRALQTDMENDVDVQERVKNRSEMFLGCIDEAIRPSTLKSLENQFYNE
jgi:predicted chitinase